MSEIKEKYTPCQCTKKNNLCIIAAHLLNIIEKALESCALKVLESRVGSVIWFGTYFTDNLGDQ